MQLDLSTAAAFAIAAVATYLVTPVAIAVAVRTQFFDLPKGYKGHRRPTPYLGGSAILVGILATAASVDGIVSHYGVLIGCAVAMWAVGTTDDRLNLPVGVRMLAEVTVGAVLWATGHGWGIFGSAVPDLLLTLFWVVGVMNAFNLMDNMDGASATTAAVSALGAGALALISGKTALAPLCLATAGACAGFLPRNLASPPRIFMGDGGSLQLGLLVSAVTMGVVSRGYLGASGVIVGALLVGLVILDTTLVCISRTRAGLSVLTGGRDHLTHRLASRLGRPRKVALTLATAQLALCGLTIAVASAGVGWVLLAGFACLAFGAMLIWQLERPAWFTRVLTFAEPSPEIPVATAPAPERASAAATPAASSS